MTKIIVLDNLSQDGIDLLENANGIDYEVSIGLAGDELREALAQADGAICRSGVKITPESLEGNTRLRAIARAGVGTDNIDKPASTRAGIVVMNTPGGNTISTAEQTIALMLGLSRNTAPAYQSLVEGRWDRKKFTGVELEKKTLGIIGLGRIGQAVAVRAAAFGMKLIGYDPYLSEERAEELGIKLFKSARDLLPHVDYLTVHTPLTDETRNLIDDAEIEQIKPGARLVNCARGGIYNEAALVKGLESGKLAGVALDVYPSEPCTDNPLYGMPGVLCTPHLGASTEEAQTNVAIEAVQLLIEFFQTGAIRQPVNVSPLDPKTLKSLGGNLELAWRLGIFLAQMDDQPPKRCKLIFRGEVASLDTQILLQAFGVGLLQSAVSDVNIVNVKMLLQERGIELIEEKSENTSVFSSLIQVELTSTQKTVCVTGTLFGESMPRLVQYGECRLESYLDGTLVLFPHSNKPGVIGRIGTVLGKHNVNIDQMAVGQPVDADESDDAFGIVMLGGVPSKEALEEFCQQDGIHSAILAKMPAYGERPAWMG